MENNGLQEKDRLQIVLNYLMKSPNELAGEIGISVDTIYNILEGSKPSIRTRRKIYEAIGLNPKWFEHGEGEMFLTPRKPTGIVEEDSVKYLEVHKYLQLKDNIIKDLEQIIAEQRKIINDLSKLKNVKNPLDQEFQ